MLKTATLAFLDFSERQQKIFSSVLFLSERNLNQDWDIVTKDLAQVIFVHSKKPISQTQWDKLQLIYPQAILVAYSTNLINLQTPWKLLTEETALTKRAKLITLLNKITEDIEHQPSKIEVSSPSLIKQNPEKKKDKEPQKTITNNLFLPENYFLSIVQMSITTGYIYQCQFKNNTVIYLLPQQSCYFCSTEMVDLKELFLMSPKEIRVKKMLDIELKQQIEGLKTKALNNLLWYATITASQGRFMTNHQPDDSVYLKSWPDISLVSENKSYLEFTVFMSHNTANVIEIAEKSQQKLSDVIDFYNACNVLGLISDPKNVFSLSKSVFDNSRKLHHPTAEKIHLQIVA